MSGLADIRTAEQKFQDTELIFRSFHEENPVVYKLFKRELLKRIRKLERKRILFSFTPSVRGIFEDIREWKFVTTGDDFYKLNNNFFKHYVFEFYRQHPTMAGMFSHRGHIPEDIKTLIEENKARIEFVKSKNKKRFTKPINVTEQLKFFA